MEWWMLIFPTGFLGFGTHVVATTVCTTRRGVYIHSPVARTFFGCTVCLRTSAHLHTCAHKRMAQVSVKRCLHMCRFSASRFFPSHVSPILAVPARSLRDLSRLRLHWRSRPHVLAVLTCPKSAGHAQLRTCIAKFGCLAKSDANTGCEPNEFDKITSVDSDTMLIDDLDLHEISDFSNNTHENKGLFGVLTMFESSVFHDSHDDFVL